MNDLVKLNNDYSFPDQSKVFVKNDFKMDEFYFSLKKIISSIIANLDSWPFKEAVNEKDAPMYYEVIKNPIDLSIINQKIDKNLYSTFNEFEQDIKLMVNNCETYNGPYNGFTMNAYAVWRLFRKLTKKYLDRDLNLEDKDAFIYPPRRTNHYIHHKNVHKRKKHKRNVRVKALDLLYNATQYSIEQTFNQFCFSPSSDIENKHLDEINYRKYQFKTDDFKNEHFVAKQLNEDQFLDKEVGLENLIFKSLNEWNEQIIKNGKEVILPEKGVVVNSSPVINTWLTNYPNEQLNYRSVLNNKFFKNSLRTYSKTKPNEKINSNSQTNNKLIEFNKSKTYFLNSNQNESANKKLKQETLLKTNKTKVASSQDENLCDNKKRLVIKLSKCNNDWRQIQLKELSFSNSESDSNEDQSSSTTSSRSLYESD